MRRAVMAAPASAMGKALVAATMRLPRRQHWRQADDGRDKRAPTCSAANWTRPSATAPISTASSTTSFARRSRPRRGGSRDGKGGRETRPRGCRRRLLRLRSERCAGHWRGLSRRQPGCRAACIPTDVERGDHHIAFQVRRCPLKDAWVEAGLSGEAARHALPHRRRFRPGPFRGDRRPVFQRHLDPGSRKRLLSHPARGSRPTRCLRSRDKAGGRPFREAAPPCYPTPMGQLKAHEVDAWLARPRGHAHRPALWPGPWPGQRTGTPLRRKDRHSAGRSLFGREAGRRRNRKGRPAGCSTRPTWFPMFAGRRLLWVRNAQGQKALADDVKALCAAPAPMRPF